jgi:hypothetical protein
MTVKAGHKDLVKLLLASGADVSVKDEVQSLCIHQYDSVISTNFPSTEISFVTVIRFLSTALLRSPLSCYGPRLDL